MNDMLDATASPHAFFDHRKVGATVAVSARQLRLLSLRLTCDPEDRGPSNNTRRYIHLSMIS